jgi:rsbT co-antagonist protein RsbR
MANQLRTRLLIGNLITVLLVAGLVIFALFERSSLNTQIDTLTIQEQAAGRARELSLYVQYNGHETNAYTLGHVEHREEFNKHAAVFATVLADIQGRVDSGVLDEDEQESIDDIADLRARYDQAASDLFAAADAQRAAPSPESQARLDAAWQTADKLGDQIDSESQELADHIQADVTTVEARLEDRNRQMILVLLALGVGISLVILAIQYFSSSTLGKPLQSLLAGVKKFAGGDLATRVDVIREDEVGVLAGAFNELAVTIQGQTEDLQAQYGRAVAAQAETEKAREQIEQQLGMIEQKDSLLREISVPVLPLSNSTMVMPLVGALDTDRLRLIQHQALHHLEGRSMKCLILDITGVPVVDTQVAQGLMQVIQSARLLGTETVVVGVRPEVAQTIVQLGINLGAVTTRSSLESGIAYALNRS